MTGNAPVSLFAGGGEVGREMAARDWADTPFGPVDQWPPALRNLVRIVLTSRFPMWAAWGTGLSFFYNDAYRRDTLQTKHPWALGRPASEVWAEIWHDIGPRVESVLATGTATWDEDLLLFLERSGYPEETYHTFSYSPVVDDDGRTAGMLCVVTENTDRVLAERRMANLRDLATAIAGTRTEAEVLAAVGQQLARNDADLPFSATYLVDDDGTARLGTTTGLVPGSPAAPETLADDAVWPLSRSRAGEQVLVDLDANPGLPTGAWGRPPTQALAVPVASPVADTAAVAGFLVVGLNPHRALDEAYTGFLELVAGQIASGLANAGSHAAERRRAEALAELDRAKTDFFSNVSHEFRTPLTLIMGPVAELRTSTAAAADPRVAEELEVVERNALRLQKLVNTLLDFSRIQAGRIDARFEPVDLAATTAELASVFRSAVDRAGLRLTVDCPPLSQPVHIDRDMWEKVVLNLLSNALKFTFEGGITVRLRQGEDAAVLTVADTGTGIPAAELPRLFERFTRVSGARARSGEGSGIGLAMVRELVGLHGGSVEVQSTPDVGTAFTVTVPLGTAHLPADRLAPAAAEPPAISPGATPFVAEALRWLPSAADDVPASAPGSQGSRAGRVLVADDNADMRDYVVRLLAPVHEVRAVADGQAALDAALADPPDLVVSDVMMPRLDGMQLLAALRADARTSRVPVVLLSARAGQEAAVEGLAAGADDYLVKPFSAQELLARVDAHLQLGRARREAEERFTTMADLAPALIWVADGTGRREFLNAAWTAFTGRPVEAELGEGWQAGLHPDDALRYAGTVAAATAAGEGWEVEFRLRRADGAHHWLLERAVPIGGTAGGWVGSCTDINARYQETERQTLLAEVGTALDRETEVDRQLAGLARLIVDRRLADVCTARVVGPDGQLRYAGLAGVEGTAGRLAGLQPHGGLGVEVLDTGAPVLRPHLSGAGDGGVRLDLSSALLVPLTVRGRVRAVLALGRHDGAPPFHDDDRALAEEIAARAALALDNALLLADERAAARRLGLLQRVTAELSAATTPVEVAEAAAASVLSLTGSGSRVGVYEVDEAGRTLRLLGLAGPSADDTPRWTEIPLSTPLAVTTAVTGRRPVWVDDVPDRVDGGPGSVAALPLLVAGRVVGVVGVGSPEAGRLGSAERGMLLAVAEQCASALDRARLYRAEQDIASTLQLSLLPAAVPRLERLALAAEYLPGAAGTSAGGDWYDVVELGRGRVAIAVGDVVGQGPAAAAVMGQLRSALSAALLQGNPPAEALELLDRFAARLPGALASTAACLVLDWAAGTVRWARAGHPPPLLVTDGSATFLEDGGGAVLGAPGRRPYVEGSTTVKPGTTLLLYTDGLVERRGEPLDTGLRRVAEAAARLGGAEPRRLTRALLAEVLDGSALPDDVAVIAARLTPPPLHEVLRAEPARLRGVRRQVTAWALAAGLTGDSLDDLQLALGEALANAVEHAYAATAGEGRCEYRLERAADGSVDVCVRDEGVWRPAPADRGYRGRGLELISALATDVEIGRTVDERGGEGAGTTVQFRFVPAGPGPDQPVVRSTGRPAESGPARLTVDRGPDGLHLGFSGEIDLAATPGLRAEALRALDDVPEGTRVLVDLEPVTYLASAGVGLALELLRVATTRRLVLRLRTRESSAPARVLSLAGVDPGTAWGTPDGVRGSRSTSRGT